MEQNTKFCLISSKTKKIVKNGTYRIMDEAEKTVVGTFKQMNIKRYNESVIESVDENTEKANDNEQDNDNDIRNESEINVTAEIHHSFDSDVNNENENKENDEEKQKEEEKTSIIDISITNEDGTEIDVNNNGSFLLFDMNDSIFLTQNTFQESNNDNKSSSENDENEQNENGRPKRKCRKKDRQASIYEYFL